MLRKRHDFFIFNFLKEIEVLIQYKLQIKKCLHLVILCQAACMLASYSLAHFCLMKKSANALHYFGLDCGL
jgi:hypothetical protein